MRARERLCPKADAAGGVCTFTKGTLAGELDEERLNLGSVLGERHGLAVVIIACH